MGWKEGCNNYIPEPNTGCWLFLGTLNKGGYGKVHRKHSRQHILAHRAMWEQENGAIPEGLKVLHICDMRCCVNPQHLYLGTQQDNVQDRKKRNRTWNKKITPILETEINQRLAEGQSMQSISLSFGLSHGTVWMYYKRNPIRRYLK